MDGGAASRTDCESLSTPESGPGDRGSGFRVDLWRVYWPAVSTCFPLLGWIVVAPSVPIKRTVPALASLRLRHGCAPRTTRQTDKQPPVAAGRPGCLGVRFWARDPWQRRTAAGPRSLESGVPGSGGEIDRARVQCSHAHPRRESRLAADAGHRATWDSGVRSPDDVVRTSYDPAHEAPPPALTFGGRLRSSKREVRHARRAKQ